jgi:shikimate kinase
VSVRDGSRPPGGPAEPVMSPDKIYLVGFMASGKTTLAHALASRLGWRAEDIDDLIEKRERLTIADIFARHGEPHFRAVEREMLRLMRPMRHVVIATGGGTFVDPENRALMNLDGLSIWIDLPLAEIIPRIPLDGRRPLASNLAELERLYASRLEAYRQAHLRVDATGLPVEAVVERILQSLEGGRAGYVQEN